MTSLFAAWSALAWTAPPLADVAVADAYKGALCLGSLVTAFAGTAALALLLASDRSHRLRPAAAALGVLTTVAAFGFVLSEPASALDLADVEVAWIGPLCLIVLGAAVGAWLGRREGRVDGVTWIVAAAVGLAGAVAWLNFGSMNGTRSVHIHDSYHYYMGSKYFDEIGYDHLYEASLIAEVDDGFTDAARRPVRDLETNTTREGSTFLGDADAVRARFTTDRWRAFQQDVRYFKVMLSGGGGSQWASLSTDHGYNATPLWTALGGLFSRPGWDEGLPRVGREPNMVTYQSVSPQEWQGINASFTRGREAFREELRTLAWIDHALYAVLFALLGWAFGPRVVAMGLLVLGTGYPWTFEWTGGGFARIPWLVAAVAGVACLKKGRPLLGAIGLACSGLFRVFPAVLTFGPLVRVVDGLVRRRTVAPEHRRFVLGGLVAVVVLVPLSLAMTGGLETGSQFLENSFKHRSTPLSNHMGLATFATVGFDPPDASIARDGYDAFDRAFKDARREFRDGRRLLEWGLMALLLGAWIWAVRRMEDWEAAATSVLPIACLFELTSYYFVFTLLLAPLAMRRVSGVVLLGGSLIVGQWCAWRFHFRAESESPLFAHSADLYVWLSAVSLVAMVGLAVLRGREVRAADQSR